MLGQTQSTGSRALRLRPGTSLVARSAASGPHPEVAEKSCSLRPSPAYCTLLARVQARASRNQGRAQLADCTGAPPKPRIGSMGDDELAVLILSGWSDGPLPALEHSLRQRGLRCVRVPLPMPPCGVYWCANPFLLLLAGVVWLAIYAWNEWLEPFVVFAILIIAGALVAARLCVAGVVRFAEWHGAANGRACWRATAWPWSSASAGAAASRIGCWRRGVGEDLRSSRRRRLQWRAARCARRAPRRRAREGRPRVRRRLRGRGPRRKVSTRPSPSSTTTARRGSHRGRFRELLEPCLRADVCWF